MHEHVQWHRINAFSDNYLWVVEYEPAKCFVVDPGDGQAVEEFLNKHDLVLSDILITHHHPDHIGGLGDLLAKHNPLVYASNADKVRIPGATNYLREGDIVSVGPLNFEVLETFGHTLGHICYHEKQMNWIFTGDTLFSGGCGRLFEGTPSDMLTSLEKIVNRTTPDTLVFCAHEYTENNYKFAAPYMKHKKGFSSFLNEIKMKRQRNEATVPFPLHNELQYNPFLNSADPQLQESMGVKPTSLERKLDTFTQVRKLKDQF